VGWARPEDWPRVAKRIFEFVLTVSQSPESLAASCETFVADTKGVQSAFLSPILNALRPTEFLVVNSKTLKTLARVGGMRFKAKLNSYPRSNSAALRLVDEFRDDFAGVPGFLAGDVFDAFCQWFVALRPSGADDDEELATDVDAVDRQSPDYARDWFTHQFPVSGLITIMSPCLGAWRGFRPNSRKTDSVVRLLCDFRPPTGIDGVRPIPTTTPSTIAFGGHRGALRVDEQPLGVE
jgi:hypothetical protein